MSQENVELTMRITDAFNRRDVEAVVELWDQEGVLHPVIEAVTEGRSSYRGHAGFRKYFLDLAEFADESTFEWSEVRDLGDRVLCLGRVSMTFSGGVELNEAIGLLSTWRNGKCREVRGWLSHAQALEAVGLRD